MLGGKIGQQHGVVIIQYLAQQELFICTASASLVPQDQLAEKLSKTLLLDSLNRKFVKLHSFA